MRRRTFLATASTAALTTGTGCLGLIGSDSSNTDIRNQEFRYYFEDETGTLGPLGAHNTPPSDAADHRIIRNTNTEADWTAMRANDIEFARRYMDGKTGHEQHLAGSPQEIIATADRHYQDSDIRGPVAFTQALDKAVITVTETADDADGAPFPELIVPKIAETAADRLGYDFPGYRVVSLYTLKPSDFPEEETILRREDGTEVGSTRALVSAIYLVIFEKNGELQLRYVERANRRGILPFIRHLARRPSKSVYRTPLSVDTYTTNYSRKTWFPEHVVTGLDYTKAKRLTNRGFLERHQYKAELLGPALRLVDAGGNDDKHEYGDVVSGCRATGRGSVTKITDEFGESLTFDTQSI